MKKAREEGKQPDEKLNIKELIHIKPWTSVKHLKKKTFTWIEESYNRARRHFALGYLTPAEYELRYRYTNELAG